MVEHDEALEVPTVLLESSVEDRQDPKAPLWPMQESVCLLGCAATSHPSPWPEDFHLPGHVNAGKARGTLWVGKVDARLLCVVLPLNFLNL